MIESCKYLQNLLYAWFTLCEVVTLVQSTSLNNLLSYSIFLLLKACVCYFLFFYQMIAFQKL